MALFVTTDAEHWHRAEFPSDHRLEEDAYTILESTNYSLQVDVMTSKTMQPIGVLFSSNSQGTFFTRLIEHTNRNRHGLVDFEKIRGIRGIVLVNVVDNWEKLDLDPSGRIDKRLRSQISFDDGRTWDNLTTDKGRDLHLHSVTNLHNSGRIFSSPAPGLVMGIGNTGDYLRPYDQGDLYVSDDAGLTWWKGQEGAHKYEFGDQGSVLVAVNDEETTDEIVYSIDHGHNWIKADLGLEGEKVRARMLTTTPDSTTQKFLLVASMIAGSKSKHYIFTIDFAGLHERTCKSSDFERWNARVDKSGDPICVMGEQQFYERRKADAECFVNRDFKDPVPDTKPCDCTEEDFECDFNFERSFDGETCILSGKLDVPTGACKNPEDTFKGTSGWRRIPGNNCLPTKNDLAREVDRKCSEAGKEPKGSEISSEITPFDANSFREYYYLERTKSSSGKDETVVMRTDQQQIFLTRDHGKTWEEILEDKHIQSIWPHRYVNDEAFFLTAGTTVYYTMDRGETFREFEAPAPPTLDTRVPVMNFHPNQKDWLIWIAAKDCGLSGGICHSDAWVSKNRGVSWEPLRQFVRKCEFITEEGRGRHDEKLVYCEQYENENLEHRLQLVSSDDWFVEDVTVPFDDIVDFATMSEFIIVAARDPDQKSLKVDASIDGKTFADAQFPRDLNVPVQRAYTVLDSSTHSVFLHVTVNDMLGQEYGTIIKSNSNGSSYVTSLNYVNRNTPGYVDFEKSQVLQGVAIVNIVDNFEGMVIGETKKLKTMITHNDGAEWDLLPAPKKDADGKDFVCAGDKCSLHLHGYTERNDPRDTYSSPSAVGVMMGVGNVGEYLGRYGDGDTFMTTDGGISWKWAKKGTYQWEYGDQGAVIVIVERGTPTDVVFYTLDEGDTWKEFIFTDKPMEIDDISTVPSDSSRMFMLWGHEIGHGGRKLATVNLDFSGLTDQKCQLDEDHPEEGDYYLWKPKHPKQDNHCLFGHVSQFHRKRTDRICYNGPLFEVSHGITKPHDIAKNCSCTRQDFECDYNYAREIDGTCALVKGMDPPNHIEDCSADPTLISYYDPTGYRRIPLTTCSGGQELNVAESHPCPGKEP
ncbi:MAG: vacuolar protein sorting/targeting protein PEP1, partial [Vezdaea acicularis]